MSCWGHALQSTLPRSAADSVFSEGIYLNKSHLARGSLSLPNGLNHFSIPQSGLHIPKHPQRCSGIPFPISPALQSPFTTLSPKVFWPREDRLLQPLLALQLSCYFLWTLPIFQQSHSGLLMLKVYHVLSWHSGT